MMNNRLTLKNRFRLKKRLNQSAVRASRLILLLLVFLLMMPAASVLGQSTTPSVSVVVVDGEITPAMAAFLENQIEAANRDNAQGIVIEIQTLGGRVDAAIQMRDAIIASNVPVAVYIQNRAISAGALISIAADTIIMAPGSHMGSAQPIPNDPKTQAFVSGEFRTTAEKTGRDPTIAMAMVDESVVIEGLVGAGEILDLTANEAFENGYADHLVSGRDDVMKVLGWEGAEISEEKPDFRFRIAQFLTSSSVATLLLVIGMLAMLVEFYTPGFGVPGIVGIICFALYFSSGLMAGYTDTWAIAVFVIGIILLIIELIVPGFGIFGISGIVAMFVGIIFAAPSLRQGVFSLMAAMVATIIAIPIFIKLFGQSRFIQRLVLSHAETTEKGYVHAVDKSDLVGQTGLALTVMRPSGVIQIDGARIDAIAEGEFLDKGTQVKVIQVEGSRVVVSAVND